jgi:hypothetical protein
MKTRSFFIMALLCLLFSALTTEAQVLSKNITLTVKEATLPQVLQKIQQQYGVRFSYLNNSLPTGRSFSAEVKNKPLAEVLDVLLAQTDIGYLEKNGQVIIKKGLPKKLPKPTTFKKLPAAAPETKPVTKAPAPPAPAVVKKAPAATAKNSTAGPTATPASTETENTVNDQNTNEPTEIPPATETQPAGNGLEAPEPTVSKPRRNLNTADTTVTRPFHFGFIYPLSSNGVKAGKYVNRVSAHALIGAAAGSELVEFAGFGNIDRSFMRGAQFSGFFNIVQHQPALNELAFLRNGGVAVKGAQFAGFMNIVGGTVQGGQFAGFMNIAKEVKGVQAAGFLNTAKSVDGAQLGGFLNRAGTVKGTQIGFINISDSISGVPIGLFNFVKKNGYKKAEFYTADDFEANFTFKMGVPKLYSMVGLAAQLQDKKRWAYGYGFGSEWRLTQIIRVNTDLLCLYVVEDSYENFPDGLFENYQVNLLNKFRLLGTIQLAKHLALFGGPTYNVFVSEHREPGVDAVGSQLVTRTIFERTSFSGTNVKMWIGFNAGLRF